VLGPDAVPEALARADIAIILVPTRPGSGPRPTGPLSRPAPRNAVGKEGF